MKRAVFAGIIVAQGAFVRRCLVRLRVRTSDLADVEQEVWCVAWDRVRPTLQAPSQTPGKGIRDWLLEVCEGRAAAYRRGRERQREAEDAWLKCNPEQGGFADPEEHLISLRDCQLARALVSTLEPDRRKVLVTYVRDGRAIGHVATRLGICEPTAYNRLRLAYADLKAAGRRLAASQGRAPWTRPRGEEQPAAERRRSKKSFLKRRPSSAAPSPNWESPKAT